MAENGIGDEFREAFQPSNAGQTKYGKRVGRPPKLLQRERLLAKEAEERGLAELKAEMPAVNKEIRRRKNLAAMKEKYRQQRAQQVEQHIPTSRICPVCKRPKPNNQQWTLVKGTSICICQGCKRNYGQHLQTLAEISKTVAKP